MTVVLHYAPHTRAGRVRWLLEELGVPYELRRLDFAGGAHRAEAYRAVHPLNRVPALELDGATTMIESGAMLVYLADRFGDRGLAPAVDAPERAAYLQWLFYVPTQLEPPLLDAVWNKVDDERKAAGRAGWHEAAAVVDRVLADGRPHLLGERFTAADVSVGSVLGWARAGGLLDAHPALLAYGRRIAARPAARAARAD
jgi:glutathione S-transferase